jgi:hypothetical protein
MFCNKQSSGFQHFQISKIILSYKEIKGYAERLFINKN